VNLVNWLFVPLSGHAHHHLPSWMAWHGRAMVLGWGILLPLGVLIARYFKVVPRQRWPDELDNKTWWHGHRLLQTAGVAIMTIGGLLAFGHGEDAGILARIHHGLGWSLIASGWIQTFGGLLRGSKGGGHVRGDHYDMTARRRVFEYIHKFVGTAAVLLAVIVIGIGLVLADAPRWMAAMLGFWWLALALLAWRWEYEGRCMDTYQAIWGPDGVHPGNRVPTIGWGVRRYSREGWNRRGRRASHRC